VVAVLYSILWILAAFKFADRNWQRYYPTLLFSALGNALYELICYNHQLWQMERNGLPTALIPILLLILIGMPVSTWIYLSQYPTGKRIRTQAGYILFFTVIFVLLEFVSVKCGAITYHNNWNLFWSLLFDIVMFVMLVIHYHKPLLGLMISSAYIVLLILLFDVPLVK
jgi:ABC-type tungstate transport system substrate-binding protein